ncbi:tetratricopeptide repeat protein [Streptomyces sp. NWU339]|uniref:FxSxx-COOH system tetratricopeptide repeat protein n=1 Tax=Streptomyces sp. NWU339 TaxID=2185284 RepID=UPI000D680710|nr:FxSxx-COOH system tetratricopeptide repeat protein [Streptomyces sp. NWU339]PWI06326.1 tetratricopeptide repeat protein [Streptomyces sp. NWU339]
MKWRKRKPAPEDGPGPGIQVADTGDAQATGGATAITGYQGPPTGSGPPAAGHVSITQTGTANAAPGSAAVTGYVAGNVTVEYRPAPRTQAPWPHQVGVIPSRAQSFHHRAEEERLRAVVDGGGTAVLRQVLTGMGGVGKTQLAADYALTAWDNGSGDNLDVLVWITASTRTAVVTGYAQAGVELCRADPGDPEQAARTFLAWLTPKAGAKPCRWLIVLDDVADPDDLRDLWPPASPHGRTLATTRRRDAALAGEGHRLIEVGLFTQAEAVAYLIRALAAHGREEPEEQLTALASDLGYLPLALAQAAAYLIDSGEDTAAYREWLADRATTLADTASDRLPDDQALPLATTWSLSLDRADALRPAGLARPMLQLATLLDPNGIPQAVLTSAPALAHLTTHRARTCSHPTGEVAPVLPEDAVRALRALHRLSLIDHTPDTPHRAVRVHQLIQRATRDTLTPDQHAQLARTAADALLAAWPEIERDTVLAQALRANTTALTTRAEQALYRHGAHRVLHRVGRSLGEAGQVTAARDHYQNFTNSATSHLGPDHPLTFFVRNRLAWWRGQAGDAAGARTAFAELLEDMKRVLGPNHPGTLTARGHLARLLGETGDAAGAAAAFAELLNDWVRVLGSDHPNTLNTRSNLAYWLGETGDAAGAAATFAEVLDDMKRVLGPNHPGTLTSRGHLARWLGEAGDAAGAAATFAELLEDMKRVLGPDHPKTLFARGHLARWLGEAGDAAGAAAAFAELLDDMKRVLGPDHPETLTVRSHLAYWREAAAVDLSTDS